MKTILENAESLDVTDEQATDLERAGVVYRCPDPDCCGMFHIAEGKSWLDVDAAVLQAA
ncbi:hypothetical protein BTK97_003677 [Burkholderia multivorans]|uniref:hypothetical protein n=1 Tax=Burkholderia multivorans TaxID=87883 RepID=UPI001C212DDB|nr:hypothetical protein [Burkholderia multivorans]EKS9914890.1 hypothetical protein [Burkholderia multivorans]MBU9284079.1 hypothetical protein [Burkholderia multivorans]